MAKVFTGLTIMIDVIIREENSDTVSHSYEQEPGTLEESDEGFVQKVCPV
jgi:hypothetical protein